ncbi:MAG: abortive infection family protein [Methylacidiphilales bacterium]|nr:abortive infection family protein [Candidatus Methylacidiphilales bacterium]
MKTDHLILKIVNRWIGVSGGYLGLPENRRFTYYTHKTFYPEYCSLDKDPYLLSGTTKDKFIKIFELSTPREKAKIIRGVIEKFPICEEVKERTNSLKNELLEEAKKLEKEDYISTPDIKEGHILELIKDADALKQNRNASSALDRLHTAFHGYLRELCDDEDISHKEGDGLVYLMKQLQCKHPKLKVKIKSQETQNIINNLVSICDSLNPMRNQASRAHPNKIVADEPEAVLVINSIVTIVTYLSAKLK